MKVGKITDSVLKRTVLKSIGRLPDGFKRPAAGRDAACFSSGELNSSGDIATGQFVTSGDDIINVEKAVIGSANNVAAAGFKPKAVNLTILLPTYTEEKELRLFVEKAYEVTSKLSLGLAGGHTEVMAAVSEPVFIANCTGCEKIAKDTLIENGAKIIMTGYAGYEGAVSILEMFREEYDRLFSHTYLRDIRQSIEELSVIHEAAVAGRHGVIAMHDIHNSGVFGALWELSEQIKKGFVVDVRSIPIKQETVEICERVDANPYELTSMGALLIVANDAEALVNKLEDCGINAAIIGEVTEDNNKLLVNKEEKGFLNKPGTDEINRIKELKETGTLCVRNY